MTDAWVPLHLRGSAESREGYRVLSEGVPDWLREQLWQWIEKATTYKNADGYTLVSREFIVNMQSTLRFDIKFQPGFYDMRWRASSDQATPKLRTAVVSQPDLMLSVTDYILGHGCAKGRAAQAAELQKMLDMAGSAYTVGSYAGRQGLIQRVDTTVQGAVDAAMVGGGAGELLAEAWNAAYGVTVDPDKAFRKAVLAVEAAASPVISPDDRRPSVGKIIASLRDGAHKWSAVVPDAPGAAGIDVVRQMMTLLWENDQRHTAQGGEAPRVVGEEEARAAVLLAATLVQWFRSGYVVKGA